MLRASPTLQPSVWAKVAVPWVGQGRGGGGEGQGGRFHPHVSHINAAWAPVHVSAFCSITSQNSPLKPAVIVLDICAEWPCIPHPQLWKGFKREGKWIQGGMCWEDTVGKPSVVLRADTNAGLIRKSILLSGWLIANLCWTWERVESWRDNFSLLPKGGLMYISKQLSVKNLLKTRHLFPLVNCILGGGDQE